MASVSLEIKDATGQILRETFGVMSTAFEDDPVIRWVQPRPWADQLLFAGMHLGWLGARGCSQAAIEDGRVVGAIYWAPPGHKPSLARRAAAILPMLTGVRGGARRAAELGEELLRRRPAEPHWYLATLGVAHRGRGIGSALLQHVLERVGGVSYLESSKLQNVALYESFGFRQLDPIELPGAPVLIPMLRTTW
jgi:GNAT superfamily N-acetyltransferase